MIKTLSENFSPDTSGTIYDKTSGECCLLCPCVSEFSRFPFKEKAKHFHQYVASSSDDTTNIENVSNIRGVL